MTWLRLVVALVFVISTIACGLLQVARSRAAGPPRAADTAAFPPPPVRASAAALIDADTGRWLYLSHADTRLPMASTTKIMTAVLAIERGHLNDLVTVSHTAATIGQTTMGLRAGERVSVRDLLYGLLLPSGNDAGIAIAEHVGGSMTRFVTMMNAKAAALHLTNTHYVNDYGFFFTPDGDSPEHFTSARDLVVLAHYAMRNPLFRRIVATRSDVIPANRYHHEFDLTSIDYVIYWYPGADGVKPGWTSGAGLCQVVDVHRSGRHLIAALLNTPNLFTDTRDLLNYGLQDFSWVPSRWPEQDRIDQAVGASDENGRYVYYPYTGHAVRSPFLTFFARHGGLGVFGFPRTESIPMAGGAEQLFTNLVLTYDARSAAVSVQHLGRAALRQQSWLRRVKPVANTGWRTYYPETGHTVTYRFRLYYLAAGGPRTFGYPITEKRYEGKALVQYFENAKFIWHPTSGDDGYVALAPLGEQELTRLVTRASTRTPSPIIAPGEIAVATATPMATSRPPSVTRTVTPSVTPSATQAPTSTATATRTLTATRSPTASATPSPTRSATPSPTRSATLPPSAMIPAATSTSAASVTATVQVGLTDTAVPTVAP